MTSAITPETEPEKERQYNAREINNMIKRAKIRVLLKYPFWGKLLSKMPIRVATWVPTAATDGVMMVINPFFVEDHIKNVDELSTVLAHEAGHAAFLHLLRLAGRDKMKWNIAGDYIINALLKESGFPMIKGILYDAQYLGWNADQCYLMLPDDPDPEDEHFDDLLPPGSIGKDGSKNENPAPLTKNEIAEMEQKAKIDLSQAAHAARQAGQLPAGLERIIDDILVGKMNWREHLRRFCTSTGKDDYSWSRPNRRFQSGKFFLPSLYSEAMGPLLIAVDTSGSIDREMLKEFAGEINKIIDDCSPERVVIMYCDTRVNDDYIQTLEKHEEWIPKPDGGGGTAFSPVFAKCEEIGFDPAACVYFTDLYCSDFGPEPHYPTLWINWAGKHSCSENVPFGEVVDFDKEA